MSDGIRAMWMRGGTSKGGYFLASDLPASPEARDALLLSIFGSPDLRQIDGMGGGDPLTSKVAIVSPSKRKGIDVDYLFLQVFVNRPLVSDAQNCGNILAGVGPFAIERGLVKAQGGETQVAIFMENTGQSATAIVNTPHGSVTYKGDAQIDGVPGSAAPVPIAFKDTAGSTCGALLPTGNAVDAVNGVEVTMIDNGMPCVVLRAPDMGINGSETPAELEANSGLVQQAGGHKAGLRAFDEHRGCGRQNRAENDDGERGNERRGDFHAHVYPAPLPQSDWRARGRERGHCLPHQRRAGVWPRKQRRGQNPQPKNRASNRPNDGGGNA